MPESSIWTLVISLVLLAIGVTLKFAESAHSLKLANDEIARLRKQLDSTQEEKDKIGIQTSKTNPLPEIPIIEPVANITNLDEHNAPKSKPPTQYIGGGPKWGKVE